MTRTSGPGRRWGRSRGGLNTRIHLAATTNATTCTRPPSTSPRSGSGYETPPHSYSSRRSLCSWVPGLALVVARLGSGPMSPAPGGPAEPVAGVVVARPGLRDIPAERSPQSGKSPGGAHVPREMSQEPGAAAYRVGLITPERGRVRSQAGGNHDCPARLWVRIRRRGAEAVRGRSPRLGPLRPRKSTSTRSRSAKTKRSTSSTRRATRRTRPARSASGAGRSSPPRRTPAGARTASGSTRSAPYSCSPERSRRSLADPGPPSGCAGLSFVPAGSGSPVATPSWRWARSGAVSGAARWPSHCAHWPSPGWRAPGDVLAGRQHGVEGAAQHRGQFGAGEEMDVQPRLGPAAIADREAAVVMLLEPPVRVLDIGAGRIDPDAEQAAGPDPGGRGGQVPVRLRPGAVLEDLDADDQVIPGSRGQAPRSPISCPARSGRGPQLRDGLPGNVQPGEVEAGVEQWQQIPPAAASDVSPCRSPRWAARR